MQRWPRSPQELLQELLNQYSPVSLDSSKENDIHWLEKMGGKAEDFNPGGLIGAIAYTEAGIHVHTKQVHLSTLDL